MQNNNQKQTDQASLAPLQSQATSEACCSSSCCSNDDANGKKSEK
jgi:hypothetical protein